MALPRVSMESDSLTRNKPFAYQGKALLGYNVSQNFDF
jgi:hypothetical protein